MAHPTIKQIKNKTIMYHVSWQQICTLFYLKHNLHTTQLSFLVCIGKFRLKVNAFKTECHEDSSYAREKC